MYGLSWTRENATSRRLIHLEALHDGIEPLAGHDVFTLGALLIDPHADGVAQADLKAAGSVERLDHLVDGRVSQRFLDARLRREAPRSA